MAEKSVRKRRKSLSTSKIAVLVFAAVIILGTVLLMLPVSSRNGECCGFKTALFTATSSTCVTGLVLADTWSQWSGVGQFVIIAMIEIGGLGFMSLASFIFILARKKVGFQQRMLIAESINSDGNGGVVRIQRNLLIGSLSVETLGALVLFLRFLPLYGASRALKLGVFHSVSAFCNAGFDIMGFKAPGTSMALMADDPVVLPTLSVLIIAGGIGFVVWDEIIRLKPKKWSVYTKLVLITTAVLLLFGWIVFCLLEWNNPQTLGGFSTRSKLLNSFFQSVTLRTAGFASFDQNGLTQAGKAVSDFLMFIGGSSGSTAGGIKTVTFVVLFLFIRSRVRGRKGTDVFKHTVSDEQVMNALSLFIIMVTLSFVGASFMCANSAVAFDAALFETISALGTVGLSTGITAQLGTASQIMLIIFMFFGRIGILTISIGFLKGNYTERNYRYSGTNLLIG
ncbi:MAG: potassium uptake protein, TrkH family [Clostridia bacterium]|nr:potassium uptake protein, TrkH family [Clostridia bacterium]